MLCVGFAFGTVSRYVFNAESMEFGGFAWVSVYKQSIQPRRSPDPLGGLGFRGNLSIFAYRARVAGPRGLGSSGFNLAWFSWF